MDGIITPWMTLMSSGVVPRCAVAATAGVLTHLVYFIRGYHVTSAYGIFIAHFSIFMALFVASASKVGLIPGFIASTAIFTSYLTALFTSIIIYRIFFHPLSRFPGPLFAKVTKIYGPWTNRNGQMHIEQTKLFAKYGDIVRVAPNELMIISASAIQKIHGAKSGFTKRDAGVYNVVHFNGTPNLDSLLDREPHRWRRQVWERAFTTSALANYELSTREVCRTWLKKVDSFSGQPIETSLFTRLITVDHMGKTGFTHEFHTIEAGSKNRMLTLLESLFGQVATLGELTWPIALMQGFGVGGEAAEFDALCVEMADRRDKGPEPKIPDIFSYFLQDYRAEKPKAFFNRDILYSDTNITLVGSTDTISAVLAYAFWHLAVHQDVQSALFEEVAPLYGKTVPGEFANSDLEKVEYLDAVINETMRLDNPVCNNAARLTPPKGVVIDGVFIPGGVAIRVPGFAMHRSEKAFVKPLEFIPERWTTREELVLDRRAFMPFLVGPFNCVGRRLAMMVSRLVLSYTVQNYRFTLAPGEDGTAIRREAKNNLILKAGPLHVVFEKRVAA